MKKNKEVVKIGIESWGTYIPELRHDAKYISEKTGIPPDVLKTKFGLNSKSIAGPEDHNVAMAVKAAKVAMRRADISPADIDLIIWAGEAYDKYLLQNYGIKLQYDIGAMNARAFDINQKCSSLILAFDLAKNLMANPGVNRILIASGYRNCDFVNYGDQKARFTINVAASGVAVLLKKGHLENNLLESVIITDGQFCEDVYVPGGGSGMPMTTPGGDEIPAAAYKVIEKKLNYYVVPDPEGMKNRLGRIFVSNLVKVIRQAIKQSGYKAEDISYLGLPHMKVSAIESVSNKLGVDVKTKTTYWDEFINLGHMGQNDGVMSLEFGVKHNKIKPGDLVVLAAAGIGYSWGATCIKWGKN